MRLYNSKIEVIIVDDEPHARNVLEKLLLSYHLPIEIKGSFDNLLEAVAYLKKHPSIDLVLLDIQMPFHSGYEIVKFFKEIFFEIIFITAYDNYALKAFELSAVDYLVKPVERERFKLSLIKVIEKKALHNKIEEYKILLNNFESSEKKIVIPEMESKRIIPIDEIVCIQGSGSYSIITLQDNSTLTVSKNLKYLQELLLNQHYFYRSQRSWLINLKFISKFNTNKCEIELNHRITSKLSKNNINEFRALMNKFSTN